MALKWNYSESNGDSILDQIKHNRKLSDDFLFATTGDMPDISLLKDIDKASERIIEAVRNKEKIMIAGHDDVDGITSTYILFDFLEKIGSQNHFYHIPNRLLESHGLQQKFIQKLLDEDFDLLITVDGGISEFEYTELLMSRGVDVIITDHHLVQEKVPQAFAVVNPKQDDCNYPFVMLAGVAVTYFLVQQMANDLQSSIDINYLFWTAVGTLADKVPLVGVNRILIKDVLEKWFRFDDPTLDVMKPYFVEPLNCEKRMSILRFITKILSNGRLPDGENLALSFMLVSKAEKEVIIGKLITEQRNHEYQINELVNYLNANLSRPQQNYLIYTDAENKIEFNLMGYAASFLTKKYMMPVIILKDREDFCSAEARCNEGFDLIEAFSFCREFLIQFGGHKKAAGFTVKKIMLENFRDKFAEFIKQKNLDIELSKKINIDAVFSTKDLDKLNEYIQTDCFLLQPFGMGNHNPTFMLKDYHPVRDSGKIKLKKAESKLEPDKTYHLVVCHRGSGFSLIDHRHANRLL